MDLRKLNRGLEDHTIFVKVRKIGKDNHWRKLKLERVYKIADWFRVEVWDPTERRLRVLAQIPYKKDEWYEQTRVTISYLPPAPRFRLTGLILSHIEERL